MFSRYKEDALKWREHEARERKRIEDEEYKLTIVIGLMDGEQAVLRKTFKGTVDWYTITAEREADRFYNYLKMSANSEGVTIDGVTYMPHTIATITRQDD